MIASTLRSITAFATFIKQNLPLNVVKLQLFSHKHPVIVAISWHKFVKKVLFFVKKLHNCTQSGSNSVNVSA